MINVVQSCVSK